MTSILASISRRGRLLTYQLQRLRLHRRLRNRKSSQRLQNRRKRRYRSQILVQDIFRIGSGRMFQPSTPSSERTWTSLSKRQLREFYIFLIFKNTCQPRGSNPSLPDEKPDRYHDTISSYDDQYSFLSFKYRSTSIWIQSSYCVCGLQSCAEGPQQLFSISFRIVLPAESISHLCSSSRGRVGICLTLPKTLLLQQKPLSILRSELKDRSACSYLS